MADVIDIILRARDEVSAAAKTAQGSMSKLGQFIKANETDFRAVGAAGTAVAASLQLVTRAGLELSPAMQDVVDKASLAAAAVGVLAQAVPAVTIAIKALGPALAFLSSATGIGLLITVLGLAVTAFAAFSDEIEQDVVPTLVVANARIVELTANVAALRDGLDPAGAALARLNDSFQEFTAGAGSVADLFRQKFGGEIPEAVAAALDKVRGIVESSTGVVEQNFAAALQLMRNDAVRLIGEDVPEEFFDAMETIKSVWAAGASEVVQTTSDMGGAVIDEVAGITSYVASSWPVVEQALAAPVEAGVSRSLSALGQLNAGIQQTVAAADSGFGFQGGGGITVTQFDPSTATLDQAKAQLALLKQQQAQYEKLGLLGSAQKASQEANKIQQAIVSGKFGSSGGSSSSSSFAGGSFFGGGGGGGGGFVNNGEVNIVFKSDASLVELAELLAEAI